MKTKTFKMAGLLVVGILPLLLFIQTGGCTMSNKPGDGSDAHMNVG